MNLSAVYFPDRMKRIMRHAENEASFSSWRVLQAAYLLIACLYEKSGVLGEISLKCGLDIPGLRCKVKELADSSFEHAASSGYFGISITQEVRDVLLLAISYMKRYNPIYMNEGHLLKALLHTHAVDDFLQNRRET
ncbi:hypothetical protein [Peribacillus sp. SCS-155]|uniref:hypothetical protein n=1 Tax=Peribacillus sedimenti TaxID=3115297 RepID=UPI0039061D64